MIVEFINGDWSDDGHGRKEHYYAEISGFLSLEQLRFSYGKGRADLGFGIEDMACEYEQYSLSDEQWDALVEDGFVWSYDGYVPEGENPIAWSGMDAEVYLEIFEYIVKKNLPGFEAKMHYPVRHPLLWGGYEAQVINEFVGYGPLSP